MKLHWPSLSIRATVLAAIVVGMVLPALVVLGVDNYVSRAAHEPLVQSPPPRSFKKRRTYWVALYLY